MTEGRGDSRIHGTYQTAATCSTDSLATSGTSLADHVASFGSGPSRSCPQDGLFCSLHKLAIRFASLRPEMHRSLQLLAALLRIWPKQSVMPSGTSGCTPNCSRKSHEKGHTLVTLQSERCLCLAAQLGDHLLAFLLLRMRCLALLQQRKHGLEVFLSLAWELPCCQIKGELSRRLYFASWLPSSIHSIL